MNDTGQPGADGRRSVKQLKVSVEAAKYQRDWFKATQERLRAGEPFCLANADAPHEIFLTMDDIPVVMTQWWSAIISAKQMSGYYFDGMNKKGYQRDLCRYCSLPLACAMDHRPSRPPGVDFPARRCFWPSSAAMCIPKYSSRWPGSTSAPSSRWNIPPPGPHIPTGGRSWRPNGKR